MVDIQTKKRERIKKKKIKKSTDVIRKEDRYMKEILVTIAVVVIVGTSGLALAKMMGLGGSCCSVHHHQIN